MNIHADGIDSLSVAIDGLRAEVDRWISEQKSRLRTLEESADLDFEAVGGDLVEPIHGSIPVRLTPAPRPVSPGAAAGQSGAFPVPPPRRHASDESGSSPSRQSGDSISSRERLDALARHLNDRLRRNKDHSSERIVPPSTH